MDINMPKFMTERKWKTVYVLISAVFVWSFALIHAKTACITYDEAYSYCSYIHPLQLTKLSSVKAVFTDCLANNHVLNTILCNLAVKISGKTWNDFVIRIPALIFCGVYLAMVLVMYHRKKIGCITASLLIWNYYMSEFLALARGYGLAAAMVMSAMVMYQLWCDSGYRKSRYLSLFLLFMTLGVLANTIVLLLFAAFIPFVFYQLLRGKQLFRYIGCQCFVWLPLLLVNVAMLRYHMMVTGEGKPLYVGSAGLWKTVWTGYAGSLVSNGAAAQAAAVLAAAVALAGTLLFIRHRSWGQTRYLFPFFCYLGILLIVWTAMDSLPRGRELLPSYPVIVLFLAECADGIWDACRKKLKSDQGKNRYRVLSGVSAGLAGAALAGLFLFRMDAGSFSDWRDEKDYKRIAYDAVDNPNADYEAIANMDYPMQYYWAQIYLGEGFDIYTGQRVE